MDTLRIGKISSINYQKGTARVVYEDRDDAVTAELPLLSTEYSMPSIDDMVLVCHLPNGSEAGIILGRFWCDGNRPTEYGAGLYRKDLGSGAYIKAQNGTVTINAPGGVVVNGTLTASGDVKASGKSVSTHKHTDSQGGTTSGPQ